MINNFFTVLRTKNEPLFIFGLICLFAAIGCIYFITSTETKVNGIHAWIKPLKFCLSTVLFSWAIGYYTSYLDPSPDITVFNWIVIIGLGFEIVYIGFQAAKGELSHYNTSSPFHGAMFSLMALAASVVTLSTAYIGIRFMIEEFPQLPDYYVWSIRLGIILFVFFSFQGFLMGANGGHTVGSPDGGRGIPFLNWSLQYGDLRIAHFIGMHALQILPIMSFYFLKETKLTFAFGILYVLLAAFTLIQALHAKPFLKIFS